MSFSGSKRTYRIKNIGEPDILCARHLTKIETPDQHAGENITFPLITAETMNRCIITCNLCYTQFATRIQGVALDKVFEARCRNDQCPNHNLPRKYRISYWWPNNLGAVYLSLINDNGYQGVKAISYIQNIRHSHKRSYNKMTGFIFKIMQCFYETNMRQVHEDLITFYQRNGLSYLDEDGILNIFVTVDGSYQRRGCESTFCITFINCTWTGRPIDFEVCVKCFSCKECEQTDSICPKGLYHGPSGSMEVANALKLF